MDTTLSRASFSASIDWRDAISDFLLQTRATREESTELFYRDRLNQLVRWTDSQAVKLTDFTARHLRQYLTFRTERGVSDATRRHDAVVTRAFLKFCKREGYIEADPLLGYQVPKSSRPYVKCPSDEEILQLLQAMQDRWKPSINPKARYVHAQARIFFSRRNYAIVAGLLETAARIGELLALLFDDYQPAKGQIAIRKSKGDEPRIVPISDHWMQAVEAYLRVRPKVESPYLFLNEYGTPLGVQEFGKLFRGYLEYAGLSGFSLHGLRHYAITQIAKTDVWAASLIAGHKDLSVTRRYLHSDPAHVRAAHEQASPLGRLLAPKRRTFERRRKVV